MIAFGRSINIFSRMSSHKRDVLETNLSVARTESVIVGVFAYGHLESQLAMQYFGLSSLS